MTPFLYVMRHGETDANAQHRLLGRLDIPLNANGLRHAAHLAEVLKDKSIVRLYSSPLQRARQTAEIIANASGAKLIIDERLIEMDFGDLDGMAISEAKQNGIYANRDRDRMNFVAPNGESYRHVAERVADFFSALDLKSLENPIAIVCHQGVIRMIAAHLGLMTQEVAAGMKIGHETILTAYHDSDHRITARIEDLA